MKIPVVTLTVEPASTNGINNTKAAQMAPQSFTLQGFKAGKSHRGLTIERSSNEKGEVIVRKVVK